jgi:hypothetical protein
MKEKHTLVLSARGFNEIVVQLEVTFSPGRRAMNERETYLGALC